MFDSKLKKLGKNVVLGFFAAITLLLTLLCLFNNAYLSWDEHTTIVADKPFYLLLWFIIVLFFVYFVRKHYRTQDTYYFNKIFIILNIQNVSEFTSFTTRKASVLTLLYNEEII